MSVNITEAHVKGFTSNVFHLSQQKGARFTGKVREETQNSKADFYDRIGAVDAQKKTTRHGDTPQLDTPHSRRKVTLVDYEWADLVDHQDKIRTLMNPTNAYAQAAQWAMGRAMDDEVIQNATGTAYSGEEGDTSVTLPTSRHIHAVASSALSNLNVGALRLAKYKLDSQDVDESIPRYMAVGSSQIQALLAETEVTSADFNTVRALVQGEINTFMGFEFLRTERLDTESGAPTFNTSTGEYAGGGTSAVGNRQCFAWAKDGLLRSVGMNPVGRVGERADKGYSEQVYYMGSFGATRMEEAKFVEVLCDE